MRYTTLNGRPVPPGFRLDELERGDRIVQGTSRTRYEYTILDDPPLLHCMGRVFGFYCGACGRWSRVSNRGNALVDRAAPLPKTCGACTRMRRRPTRPAAPPLFETRPPTVGD